MTEICVIATGAVSALGTGRAAWSVGAVGDRARSAIGRDERLADAGLARPFAARAPAALGVRPFEDHATALLGSALEQLCVELDSQRPAWRAERVGVAIGTSSGGMLSAERWFAARARGESASVATIRAASYFAPFCDALGSVGIDVGDGTGSEDPKPAAAAPAPLAALSARRLVPVRATQVLAACASSTIAIGLGLRWLERDGCDLVIAGGYDGLSLFVAAGFEALRATTASSPRPFRLERDGMSLGEGAAVVALVRRERCGAAVPRWRLTGFGASNDAVHITAPDRTGAGLARAARAALGEAGPRPVDLVSAHATSTPYNDAMEAKAIMAACGDGPQPVVHPFKAQIGHTLGAAGVLELLAAADALERGIAPAAAGEGTLDPEAAVLLLERAEPRALGRVLKLSAAFAGVTAALVLDARAPGAEGTGSPRAEDRMNGQTEHRSDRRTEGRGEGRAAVRRAVYLHGHTRVSDVDRDALAAAVGLPRDRLARVDDLGQLALAAVAALAGELGRDALAGAGMVMGHALATIDVNERFHERMRSRGPRFVDPRLFPATTPNAGAGHCAIAFGLTGPNFAVNAGLGGGLEALAAAAELVAAGDAERMIVVAADDAGPLAHEWLARLGLSDRPFARGAAAVLLAAEPPATTPARLVPLDALGSTHSGPIGHLALDEWLAGSVA